MKSLSNGERFFLFLLLVGFSSSAGALYYETAYGGRKHTGVQVGTITYKNKTAEQKQTGSNVWFQAPQGGPVFNYDTIRTGPGSSAVIELDEQRKLELGEESMVLIRIEDKKATIALAGGSLQVTNETGAAPFSLETEKGTVSVTAGSVLLQESAGSLSIRAVGGDAAIDTGKAAPITVSAAESFNIGENAVKPQTLNILSPTQNDYLVSTSERTAVNFAWEPAEKSIALEISMDKNFSRPLYRNDDAQTGISVHLAEGAYYWRIPGENASGSFTVIRGKAPVITGATDRQFTRVETTASVPFSWSKAGSAERYLLEVFPSSAEPNSAPVVSLQTTQRSLLLDFNTDGVWYWRVSALFGPKGVPFTSAQGTFTITSKKPSPPEITAISTRMIVWKPVAMDAVYEVRAAASQDMVDSRPIGSTQNTWLPPAKMLVPGDWHIQVRATIAGVPGDWSGSSLLSIADTKPLAPLLPAEESSIPLSSRSFALTWSDPNQGAQYRVLVSPSPDLASPVIDALAGKPSYTVRPDGFTPGTWYWGVSLVGDDSAASLSPVRSFILIDKIETPKPASPVGGAQLELNELEQIELKWKAVDQADSYIVRMYRMTGGIPHFLKEWTTAEASLDITDLSDFALDSFAWELIAVKTSAQYGVIESDPVLSYFRIVQSKPLALPSIRSMKTKGGY